MNNDLEKLCAKARVIQIELDQQRMHEDSSIHPEDETYPLTDNQPYPYLHESHVRNQVREGAYQQLLGS